MFQPSLSKTRTNHRKNCWAFGNFSLDQLNNYQFPTVEEIPNEGEHELPTINSKKNEIQEAVQEATVP